MKQPYIQPRLRIEQIALQRNLTEFFTVSDTPVDLTNDPDAAWARKDYNLEDE